MALHIYLLAWAAALACVVKSDAHFPGDPHESFAAGECLQSADAVDSLCRLYGEMGEMCAAAQSEHDKTCYKYGQEMKQEKEDAAQAEEQAELGAGPPSKDDKAAGLKNHPNLDNSACVQSGDAINTLCTMYGDESRMCRAATRQHETACLAYGKQLEEAKILP